MNTKINFSLIFILLFFLKQPFPIDILSEKQRSKEDLHGRRDGAGEGERHE